MTRIRVSLRDAFVCRKMDQTQMQLSDEYAVHGLLIYLLTDHLTLHSSEKPRLSNPTPLRTSEDAFVCHKMDQTQMQLYDKYPARLSLDLSPD